MDVRIEAGDEEELEMLGIGLKSDAETWCRHTNLLKALDRLDDELLVRHFAMR